MTPVTDIDEAQTRAEIDRQLVAAGWVIQDKKRINLVESLGVAVREMDTDTGPADYMLFVDGKACGVIEADLLLHPRLFLIRDIHMSPFGLG